MPLLSSETFSSSVRTPRATAAVAIALVAALPGCAGPAQTGSGPADAKGGTIDGPVAPDARPTLDAACLPESDAELCAAHAAICGPVIGVDNCGAQRTADCGRCAGGTPVWTHDYGNWQLWGNWSGLPAGGSQIALDSTGSIYVAGNAGWYTGSRTALLPGFAKLSGDGSEIVFARWLNTLGWTVDGHVTSMVVDEPRGRILLGTRVGENGSAKDTILSYSMAGDPIESWDGLIADATSDGGIAIAAQTAVTRRSSAAQVLWTTPAPADAIPKSLHTLPDDSMLLLVGHSDVTRGYPDKVILTRLSPNGATQWQRAYVDDAGEPLIPSSMSVNAAGEIFITAHTLAAGSAPFIDRGVLIKLDATGNELWRYVLDSKYGASLLEGVTALDDGGAVAVGSINLYGDASIFYGAFDSAGGERWVIDTDPPPTLGGAVYTQGDFVYATGAIGERLLLTKHYW
jgi:hypothetical protein